jgi:hypothetical protein
MLPEVITASAGKDSHLTWNAGMDGYLMIHHLNKNKLLD